jgi:hypothetical protein
MLTNNTGTDEQMLFLANYVRNSIISVLQINKIGDRELSLLPVTLADLPLLLAYRTKWSALIPDMYDVNLSLIISSYTAEISWDKIVKEIHKALFNYNNLESDKTLSIAYPTRVFTVIKDANTNNSSYPSVVTSLQMTEKGVDGGYSFG